MECVWANHAARNGDDLGLLGMSEWNDDARWMFGWGSEQGGREPSGGEQLLLKF